MENFTKLLSVNRSIADLYSLVRSPNFTSTSPFSSQLKLDMILISAIESFQRLLTPELLHVQSRKNDLQSEIQQLPKEIQEIESVLQPEKNRFSQLSSELKQLLEQENQIDQNLDQKRNQLVQRIVGSSPSDPFSSATSTPPPPPPPSLLLVKRSHSSFSSPSSPPPASIKKSSGRCQIEREGLIAIVSSFEKVIRSAHSLEDLNESTCWTLLKEVGIRESVIEKIETKLFGEENEENRSLKSMMLKWSQTLLIDQMIEELEDLVDAEEASRLMLSLQMISKGLKMVRLPHWMMSHSQSIDESGESSKNLMEIHLKSDDLQEEWRRIIPLMDENDIFSGLPTSRETFQRITSECISSIQLMMRTKDPLLPHFRINSQSKAQIAEFFEIQQQQMWKELEEQIHLLKSPKVSHNSEDKYICLFVPASDSLSSQSGVSRIKYLSTEVGISAEPYRRHHNQMEEMGSGVDVHHHFEDDLIFDKIHQLVDEIKRHLFGTNNDPHPLHPLHPLLSSSSSLSPSSVSDVSEKLSFSASRLDADKWVRFDGFLTSVFQQRERPEGLQSFKECLKVTELDLGASGITDLPPDLSVLANLQTLKVRFNRLSSIPPEIGDLLNLKKLQLEYNQLRSVPAEISRLESLQTLHLQRNQLLSIPSEIGRLLNLQQLYLNYNQLPSVPTEICDLLNLQELYLNQNQLQSVPAEISQLVNLRTLYLNENQLQSMPKEICRLESLRTLHLWNNKLQSVPEEMGQLVSLQELYLNDNQLQSVPTEIGQLVNLRTLYLNDNQLQSIPAEISQLFNLRKLHLNHNPQLLKEFWDRNHSTYSLLSKLEDFQQ